MSNEPLKVWYCANARCRKVIRVEPKWAMPKGCKCKVPRITHPTLVYTA